jgi:hypothetical protein
VEVPLQNRYFGGADVLFRFQLHIACLRYGYCFGKVVLLIQADFVKLKHACNMYDAINFAAVIFWLLGFGWGLGFFVMCQGTQASCAGTGQVKPGPGFTGEGLVGDTAFH